MNETLPDITAALDALTRSGAGGGLSDATVLVTGARGYLGRYAVALLLEYNRRAAEHPQEGVEPCQIIAMDSLLVGDADRSEWHNQPNLFFLQHDVRHDLGGVVGFGLEKVDYVLHLAGIASPHWYRQYPLETISVAVDGTRHMLDLAKHYGARFLFTSSSEVYQTAEVVPTPETYVGAIPSMNQRSCYDVSKLLGETLCYVYADKHQVDASVVRIFNSFGPGMRLSDRRILPRIASAIRANRPLPVFVATSAGADGALPKRTYTPVANTLFGLFLVLLKGARVQADASDGVYNLGLDSPEVTVPELCEVIGEVTGQRIRVERYEPPPHYATEPMRRCPDISRLKALGFECIVPLKEGLRRYFDWALQTYDATT